MATTHPPESPQVATSAGATAPPPGRAARTPRSRASRPVLRGLAGVVGFGVLLELVTRSPLVDPQYLPPFSRVLGRALELLVDADFLGQVGATVTAWALSMLLSVAIAVPLGIAIGLSGTVSRMTALPIEILRPLPSVAMVPLFILVFGTGLQMKVLLVTAATVWPILFNTIYGIRGIDPVAVATARVFGLPRLAIIGRVVLPASAPLIATGVRIASSLGLIVVVGGELVAGSSTGIGSYILSASLAGNITVVLAGSLVAGLLGIAINAGFELVERRSLGWAHEGGHR